MKAPAVASSREVTWQTQDCQRGTTPIPSIPLPLKSDGKRKEILLHLQIHPNCFSCTFNTDSTPLTACSIAQHPCHPLPPHEQWHSCVCAEPALRKWWLFACSVPEQNVNIKAAEPVTTWLQYAEPPALHWHYNAVICISVLRYLIFSTLLLGSRVFEDSSPYQSSSWQHNEGVFSKPSASHRLQAANCYSNSMCKALWKLELLYHPSQTPSCRGLCWLYFWTGADLVSQMSKKSRGSARKNLD